MRLFAAVFLIAGTAWSGHAQLVIPEVSSAPASSAAKLAPHSFSTASLVESAMAGAEASDRFLEEAMARRERLQTSQVQSPFAPKGVRIRGNRTDELDRADSRWTSHQSSSHVPLDSWIYEAFDRLIALGYIGTNTQIVRPWTRLECARLLAEAYMTANDLGTDESVRSLLSALDTEFVHETNVIDGSPNESAEVESIYSRFTDIAGTPLRDGYHFGETLANDFGRPYGQGGNNVTGFSARTSAGPLAIYVRGEYQYASAIAPYNAAAQQAMINPGSADFSPYGWNLRFGTTSRVRPVEAYAAFNFADWEFSFGQQSLWWSPDRTTSLILSNNAEAMPMVRLSRVKPLIMSGIFKWAKMANFNFFFARQGGIHYVQLGPNFTPYGSPDKPLTPPPYLWGAELSIKPTPNLELGFAHTVLFAGYGRPLTFSTFFHSFSALGNGQDVDPGKRTEDFIFSYRLPGIRTVSLYNEAFTWDDPIQGKFVARYAMAPGIYISRIPGLKKMDLRAEGVYTNLPKLTLLGYFYSNFHYPQGYTNYGQLLGSWIGREGAGGKGTLTYWLSARNKASLSYRKMTVNHNFFEGGNMNDVSGNLTWLIHPDFEFSAMGQWERWNFPLLHAGPQNNFTTSFEVRFHPKPRLGRN